MLGIYEHKKWLRYVPVLEVREEGVRVEQLGEARGNGVGGPRRVRGARHEQMDRRLGETQAVRQDVHSGLRGQSAAGPQVLIDPAGRPGKAVVGAQLRPEGGVDPDESPVEGRGLAAQKARPLRDIRPVFGRARDRAQIDGSCLRLSPRTEGGPRRRESREGQ